MSSMVMSRWSTRTLRMAALTSVALLAVSAQTTLAQTAADDNGDATEGSELTPEADETIGTTEILVTTSRTRSSFEAPSPLQIIDSEALEARSATNISTLLQENPATSGTRANTAANGVRTQTPGQNFIDLRALGTPRTLTLVNGRRFVPTVPGNSVGNPYQVDINLIPSLMVDRLEIVTGGASAQWGSDAVAGVVNVILRRRYEGIRIEGQAGISQRGDYDEQRLGAVAGTSFANGRARVVVSGDYVRNGGIADGARDWSDDNCYFFTDPTATATNGRPQRVLECDAQPGNYTGGGLIVSATGGTVDQRAGLVGMQFDSATQVSPFVRGLYNPLNETVSATTTTQTFVGTQVGGANPEQDRNSLFVGLERMVFYGHLEYELSDSLTVFAQASYGESTGFQDSRALRDQAGIYNPTTGRGSQVRIYADNPFIPDPLRSSIPLPAGPSTSTPPSQSFVMSRGNYDFPQSGTELTDRAHTLTLGLEGQFGRAWNWDASFVHGRNDYLRTRANSRDRARYAMATDAVYDQNGQIACRSTLTDSGNGCVPLNLFGQGTPSSEALDWVMFDQSGRVKYTQDAAQLNFQGTPFATWAGPVSTAVGVEWRQESAKSTVDARSATGVPDSAVGAIYDGEFNVAEGYVEATVPLLADIPLARSLVVNGALRHAQYGGDASATAGETTWKVGAIWEVFDGFRARATRSLDIRAPSLYELKVPATTTNQNIVFNGVQYTAVRVSQAGNIDLKPERAKTVTAGVSFSPRFAPRLELSADYWDIELNDVISTLGAVPIARNCANGITSFCDLLVLGPGNRLEAVNDSFLNLTSFRTSGVDFLASYTRPLLGGNLRLRGSVTFTDRFTITTPDTPPVVEDYAGINGTLFQNGVPHWKGSFTAGFDRGAVSFNLHARYVGPGRIDKLREVPTATEPAEISREVNRLGGYVVFNLGGTVRIGQDEEAEIFWNVDNLFDRDPPIAPNFSSAMQTNGALYDMVGRYFRVGARLRF